MTSAYSVFPNQGVRMTPYSVLKVTDREGNLLEENRPEPKDAIRADTAYVMTSLLRGVVQRGTAAKAAALELADRRQDRHDRRLHRRVVHRLRSRHHGRRVGRLRPEEAARAGHDRRRSGAADLDRHHEGVDRRPQGCRPKFEPPGNIVFVSVDKGTGSRPSTTRPAPSAKRSSPARSRVRYMTGAAALPIARLQIADSNWESANADCRLGSGDWGMNWGLRELRHQPC